MSNIYSLQDLSKHNGSSNDNRGPGRVGGGGSGGGNGGFPFGNLFGGFGNSGIQGESKNVHHFKGDSSSFQEELRKAGGKLVVIDFSASWCGPCKMIAPIYSKLSDTYQDVYFMKVDVDENRELSQFCGIRSMPTFQFFRNGKKIEEFSGASSEKLQQIIEKHRSSSTSNNKQVLGNANGMSTGYVLGHGTEGTSLNPFDNLNRNPVTSNQTQSISYRYKEKAESSSHSSSINEQLLPQLIEMGFSGKRSREALENSGGNQLEPAIEWLFSHPDEEKEERKDQPEDIKSLVEAKSNSPLQPISSSALSEAKVDSMMSDSSSNSDSLSKNAECSSVEKNASSKLAPLNAADLSDFDSDDESNFETNVETEENKNPLSPEEIENQKQRLSQKLKQLREKKIEEQKREEKEKELNRRKGGKEAIEAKKKWEERTKERELLLKKKEKDEERRAKLELKQKLEQDKLERKAKLNASMMSPKEAQVAVSEITKSGKKEYTECTLQFRFPDGNAIKASFKPGDTVQTAWKHVSLLVGNGNFSLMTTFPKRIFSPRESLMETTTLAQAEMVPTGTFIVTGL